MAVQNSFFGRREPSESLASRLSSTPASANVGSASVTPAAPAVESAAPEAPQVQPTQTQSVGSKLTVGPNIKLKGVEITDCDTLVVEGTVEATMDSRLMQISEQGAFRGAAEIDIAEIRGEFNGTLTVRDKLVVFGTGKVSGKIRYGKLVVEEGGQLSGEIEVGTGTTARPAGAARPVDAPAPAVALA